MGKRADYEGTYRKRKDGTWEGRVQVAGRRVSVYGKTRADAANRLRTVQRQPLRTADHCLLADWVPQWLDERQLRASSLATYGSVLGPILVDLGHVRLDKLNPQMLSLQFSLLRERGKGARRLQLAHGYLKSCLGRAVEMGLIASNPMAVVARPKWTAKKKDYWTLEQAQRFLLTCESYPMRYGGMFLLIAATGLRISEALALEPEDVDPETGSVTVSRALVWYQGLGYVPGEPKSRASHRSVAVPSCALGALEQIPFRTRTGQLPYPSILRRTLTRLCEESSVPVVSVHALRHVHAALAYHATGDAYAVQQRLGHASVTTTMGMYGFGLKRAEMTRDALDELFTREME